MQTCKRGHELNPENTYVYPSGKRRCKTCKQASDRAYRQRVSEKCKASARKYRQRNPEKRRASDRKYYEQHRDERLAYKKRHHRELKERRGIKRED